MFSAPSPTDLRGAFRRALLFIVCSCAVPLQAGTYVQNFSTGTVGTQTIGGGDASVLAASAGIATTKVEIWAQGNKALQLMAPFGGNSASWKMPDLDAGKEIQGFDATFTAGTVDAMARA